MARRVFYLDDKLVDADWPKKTDDTSEALGIPDFGTPEWDELQEELDRRDRVKNPRQQ